MFDTSAFGLSACSDPDRCDDEAALIEGISGLERLKAAAAAGQARLTVRLDALRRAAEAGLELTTEARHPLTAFTFSSSPFRRCR